MVKKILLAIFCSILLIISVTTITNKYIWDVTSVNKFSLSKESLDLLTKIQDELQITVYSKDVNFLNTCAMLLNNYQQKSIHIKTSLPNQTISPHEAMKLKLYTDQNIVIQYKNATQGIDINYDNLSEQTISTLLQKTLTNTDRWLVFLTGHQEIDPLDQTELGLSDFVQTFMEQGMAIATLNLAQQQAIPQNTAILVVVNPQQSLLPLEKQLLHNYLATGGNLLWFTEPNSASTDFLSEEFGLKPSKGVAIDPASLKLGSPHPAIKIITDYPTNSITQSLTAATIFPWSAHLHVLYEANGWEQTAMLNTNDDTWSYAGPETADINILQSNQEYRGPLNLAFTLQRQINNQQQRALVVGDSSFILNKYIKLYANKQIANNMVSWATQTKQTYNFGLTDNNHISYIPSNLDRWLYQYIFTIAIPLLLICVGLWRFWTSPIKI